MGLVKTPEEIERIQFVMSRPRALGGEMISIEFRTTREVVERLLPPGLEPVAEPTGIAIIGRYGRSNAHAFSGGGLYLNARHEDLEGGYCISMPIDTEPAIVFGREMIGEPKKLCTVGFEREGEKVHGVARRYRSPMLEIEASLTRVLPEMTVQSRAFHYKFNHDISGVGLQSDPILVVVDVEHRLNRVEMGTGTLTLGNSPHDPLGEIEVVETGDALYTEGDLMGSPRALTTVSAEDFLPYAYSKIDDFTLLDNEHGEPWGEIPS